MVSVVNGFTCFSSCDEVKARQGKDPHPSDTGLSGDSNAAKKSAFSGQPAAILDGALWELNAAVAPVDAGSGTTAIAPRRASVNILA